MSARFVVDWTHLHLGRFGEQIERREFPAVPGRAAHRQGPLIGLKVFLFGVACYDNFFFLYRCPFNRSGLFFRLRVEPVLIELRHVWLIEELLALFLFRAREEASEEGLDAPPDA